MNRLTCDPQALALHTAVNRTAMPYPARTNVKELFEEQVRRSPESRALVSGDRVVTYRELNRRANALAADVLDAGARPGEMVGVCADRSVELVMALTAVLKTGCAYVPIDVAWPDERLRAILAETGCRVVLTDRVDELTARFPDCRALPVDGSAGRLVAINPVTSIPPDALAYVNFTSGSTGRPKGVPIQHRAITRLVFNARYARLDENAIVLHMAPISFDAATFEIWGPLLRGGTCVLYPSGLVRLSELGRMVREHGVTIVFLTTALFNLVVDEAPEVLDDVGTILTGGEAHSLAHIDRALRRYGPDRLVSVYGPTESTTFATYYPVRSIDSELPALPIGLPIQNTRLYVVDDGRLCRAGQAGEICLAGPGLSPGYLGMADLTRQQFVECEIDGVWERLYRTGDRGYLLEDGNVVFQGRLDDQVKVNGHRVELGEVAHHLDRHPGVRQSCVAVSQSPLGERSLVAFVVPATDGVTAAAIREYLLTRLPRYMVPATVALRDALPLSGTGKVDRGALLREQPT